MAEKKQYTRKQHFIPQFHFRNFSSMENGIYRFDLTNPDKDSIVVPINSECYKKDLYEIREYNNTIVSQNYIEDIFSEYEYGIANTINHIKRKADNPSNLESSLFLTTEEKTTLSFFLTLEILRTPEMIQTGKDVFLNTVEKTAEEYEASNYVLLHMFPLPNVNMQDDIAIFKLYEWFADKTFRVGISKNHNIYLGDIPYYFERENPQKAEIPIIAVFPLSSRIVLFIYPKKNIKVECRNRLFELDDETVKMVQSSIVNVSKRWIYSYSPISGEEKEIIKNAIKTE